jgi:hypothetical protein
MNILTVAVPLLCMSSLLRLVKAHQSGTSLNEQSLQMLSGR